MPEKRSIVRTRDALSQLEAESIFAACDGLSSQPKYNEHWKLFFKGLWYSGLRVNELLDLRWESVKPGELIIRPLKTRNPSLELVARPVPTYYTEDLIAFPLRWHFKPVLRVFPWDATTARRKLTRLGNIAGIGRELNPHLFRHGFGHMAAAKFEEQGVNPARQIGLLKGVLGHRGSGIDSVTRYQRPTQREIQQAGRSIFE